MTIFLCLLLIPTFILVNRMVESRGFSLVCIHLWFKLVMLIISAWYYFFWEDRINLFGVDDISLEMFISTFNYYLLAALGVCLGFIFFYITTSRKARSLFKLKITLYFLHQHIARLNRLPLGMVAILLLCLSLSLLIAYYGTGLWDRDAYYVGDGITLSVAKSINNIVSLVFILICALLFNKKPLFAFCLIFIFIVFHFGTGSRRLFMYWLVWAWLVFFIGKKGKKEKLLFFVSCLFSAFLLVYIMGVRSLSDHGLFPYISHYKDVFEQFIDSVVYVIYYVSAFSFFVTSNVMSTYQEYFNWGNFLIAVNPMPGRFAGWYEINDSMRLSKYAPFNAYGEVFSGGYIFTGFYFTIIGVVYGVIDKRVRKYYVTGKIVFAVLLFILGLMSIIFSYQYNLRSGVRFFYYSAALIMVYSIWLRLVPANRVIKKGVV